MSAAADGEGEALGRIGRALGWGEGRIRHLPETAVFGALLDAFGARPAPLVVKVAGTNGKGSVAVLLSAALQAAGHRVLTFTSPHLERVTERIRVDGREIAPAELDRLLAEVEPVLLGSVRRGGPPYAATYFQSLLLAAWHAATSGEITAAVLEAGIGGATDVVSLIPAPLSVITTVSADHLDRIGPTLADVARNKAGIADPGSTLVLGPGVGAAARAEIEAVARARAVHVAYARREDVRVVRAAPDALEAEVEAGDEVVRVRVALGGHFQRDNLATVAAAVRELATFGGVTSAACLAGVERARWPGRFELAPGEPEVLLDVAHNPESAGALGESLGRHWPERRPVVVYGAADGKEAGAVAPVVAGFAREVHLAGGFYRAQPPEALAARLPGARAHASVGGALAVGLEAAAAAGVPLVVTGSVFLVGEARTALRRRGYAFP